MKIGWQNNMNVMSKTFLNREFALENGKEGKSLFSGKILKDNISSDTLEMNEKLECMSYLRSKCRNQLATLLEFRVYWGIWIFSLAQAKSL